MEKKNSDAKIRANNKYNAAHTKIIPIRLNFSTDEDILKHLESVPSVAGYIKELIRKDMNSK